MDRYKFRGKAIEPFVDGNQWISGFGVFMPEMVDETEEAWLYTTNGVYEVDPSTVGQYTGLSDKNGVEVFKGDIVKQTYEKSIRDDDGYWYTTSGYHIGVVVVDKRNGVCIKDPVRYTDEDGEKVFQKGTRKSLSSYRTEVIGNIHDNKELLQQ